MYAQRCPECGKRLNTNYCDICMKKVPFGGVKLANRRDPWENRDGSSAHRMEKDHECVSFEKPEKKSVRSLAKKHTTASKKKAAPVLGVILAILSLLPALFGLFEEAADSVAVPEPEYNIRDGFVEAGDFGAENVPNVIAGEIYNDGGIRITADTAGLSYGEYVIYFTIHNDTNKKINVNFENISVNRFMLPFGAYQEVKAGKSEQFSIVFYADELEKTGITQVAEIAFELYAYEANGYEDIVVGELVTVQTEAENVAEPAVDTSGMELYNDGSFRVLLQDVSMPLYGECQLDLYMENFSGSTASVFVGGAAVNGETVACSVWNTLRPDTRAIDNGYVYELDSIEIEELSQIEEITLELYIEYMDGSNVAETISEAITFDPNAIP